MRSGIGGGLELLLLDGEDGPPVPKVQATLVEMERSAAIRWAVPQEGKEMTILVGEV